VNRVQLHQQPTSGGMLLVRGGKEVSRSYDASGASLEFCSEQVADLIDVQVVRCE
jgi:hypothetical protein